MLHESFFLIPLIVISFVIALYFMYTQLPHTVSGTETKE